MLSIGLWSRSRSLRFLPAGVSLPSRLSRVRVPSPAFSVNCLSEAASQADWPDQGRKGFQGDCFCCVQNPCSNILPTETLDILPPGLGHSISGLATFCLCKLVTGYFKPRDCLCWGQRHPALVMIQRPASWFFPSPNGDLPGIPVPSTPGCTPCNTP